MRPKASAIYKLAVFPLGALVLTVSACVAQTANSGALPTAVRPSDLHVFPVMGFNFAIDAAGQHNSSTGWAEIVTPDLSFRFNKYISLSANVSWYPRVNAYVTAKSGGVTTEKLISGQNLIGDTSISAELSASHKRLNELLIPTVGFGTGNYRYGLGANATTYNVTNHLDWTLGPFDPDLEVGIGDSSSLANPAVHRTYTAVGTLANFQAGTAIYLPLNLIVDCEGYEELPVGNQDVYGSVTKKGKKGKTRTVEVLEGTGVAEDNGFTTELDLPVGHHLMLAASYARSLIQGLDTVSAGITWTARSPKIPRLE